MAFAILCWVMGHAAYAQDRTEYARAVAAVRQGRPADAVPMLQKILADSPADLSARNLMGIALMSLGRKAEAAAEFERALSVDPAFAPALKNLAIGEIEVGRATEARAHFTRYLELSPADPVAHFYLGELDYSQKQFTQALAHYAQCGGMHLKDAQPLLHFAEAAVETRDPEAAALALSQLPEAAPPEAHFLAGSLLAKAEKYALASAEFRRAQGGSVDPYQAAYNLVLTSLKAGQFRDAVEAAEAAISQGRKTAELYNLLAAAHRGRGQLAQAYDALRTAIGLAPTEEGNYLDLAQLAIENSNAELALETCRGAAQRIPRSYRVQMQLGAALALTGRLTEAEQAFSQAVRLSPQSNVACVAVAMTQMQSGKVAEAVSSLRERRAGTPRDYLVNRYLGEALSREGAEPGSAEEAEAAAALQTAVSVNPNAPSARVLLGKLLFARGDLDSAAAQFEEALRLDPDDVSPAYQLALIYRKRGHIARADELFDLFARAKKAEPRDAAALELLKAIGAR